MDPRPSRGEAIRIARAWQHGGVHKWMAYDRVSGERIGRGGLSRAYVDGQQRLELGWALHRAFSGFGYATEFGHAGLAVAFDELGADELGADEVISFTGTRNTRSRAVMERLGFATTRDISINDEPFARYILDWVSESST
jgi:RimJ/RimL family protein N-acetyltransferase